MLLPLKLIHLYSLLHIIEAVLEGIVLHLLGPQSPVLGFDAFVGIGEFDDFAFGLLVGLFAFFPEDL